MRPRDALRHDVTSLLIRVLLEEVDLQRGFPEAGLAASTTQVKESALEIEDLRERNAALEEDVVALQASSSFEDSTAKGTVQHRRLDGACDCAKAVSFFGGMT